MGDGADVPFPVGNRRGPCPQEAAVAALRGLARLRRDDRFGGEPFGQQWSEAARLGR